MDRWEDLIDVDDSDLFSVLPRPIPSCSSSPQALPRSLRPCSQNPCSSQALDRNPPPPSQSQLPIVISETNQIEENLNLPSASTYRPLIPGPAGAIQAAMRRQSAVAAAKCSPLEDSERDEGNLCVREEDEDFKLNPWLCALNFLSKDSGSSLSHQISSINTEGSGTKRIPQVIGIVKCCRPNGLGDLFIMLKDPTGTISAAVHRNVLSEGNFGEKISLGCVFILKQVVAFCPARSQCYLNITLKNVVKLIPKDCGPPEKQIVPPFTAMYGAEGNDDLSFNSRHNANVQSRRNFIGERMVDSRKAFLPESLSGNICAAAASANIALKSRTQMNEPKRLISGASVAEWTDEQLEKLFSEYDDDFLLVRPDT